MTLHAAGLAVTFGDLQAVKPCSLEFGTGGIIGLLGPNGAGKTSLVRALAGLVPASGSVYWRGESTAAIDRRRRARTIAYLPQGTSLPWPLRVRELVELGRLPHLRFGEAPRDEDHAAIARAMAEANVTALADRRIDELSGGERMRAHIARVLAVEAPVMLVDEPVANLDPAHQIMVMELLRRYAAEDRCVIAVMHDLTLAARYCDRIVLLREGAIAGDGRPGEVLSERSLRAVYGIAAIIQQHGSDALVVPWRRLDAAG